MNKLSESIQTAVEAVNFGPDRQVVSVISDEILAKVQEQGLGMDNRALPEAKTGISSVFEGLDFDPENLRSQAFSIYEGQIPIGLMTMVIAPRSWLENQRYLLRETVGEGLEAVKIIDFREVVGGDKFPDVCVMPAWTKVADKHRTKLALPGFRAFHQMLSVIQQSAPDNTYLEMVAQGQLVQSKSSKTMKFIGDKPLGSSIESDAMPFDISLFGKNSPGSSSTVKMAKLLGLQQAENIASIQSLGPVFFKQLK